MQQHDNAIRRRLYSIQMPAYGDFLVVFGLMIGLLFLLRILLFFSNKWRNFMKKRIKDAIELRKSNADPFRKLNGYSWDYVLVFKVHTDKEKLTKYQEENSMKKILDKLADAGLHTKLFYSVQNDEVYCKIRAPMKRLLTEADRIDYKVELDPTALACRLREGNSKGPPEKHWSPVELSSDLEETTIAPYDHMFIEFDIEHESMQTMLKRYEGGAFLRGVDRLKLIMSIIKARRGSGGCYLDILRLIEKNCLLTAFALHDMVELRSIEDQWLNFFQWPWNQKHKVARDYFGEKIAFYFAFLSHYTTWLLPAGIIGFLCWIDVAALNNNPNAPIMPYFAAFVAVWSTLMLEYWKRTQSRQAMQWGTTDFNTAESDRPEFVGEEARSPITGAIFRYFSTSEYIKRLVQSTVIITVLILIVVGIVAGIFVLNIIMRNARERNLVASASIITSLANAVQIQVLNFVYQNVAIFLNDYENHRTDTSYENALMAKTFIFQFVNSFASLFYIAFIKPYIQDKDPCVISCMVELQVNLGAIFLSRLTTGSIMAVVMPLVMKKLAEMKETKGVDKNTSLSNVELQFLQAEYHVMLGTFDSYANLAMQFGYATMFIVAYPLAMIMSFVNNYVELRIDAWKLCQLYRRPEPRSAENIGTWMGIFEIMSGAAVLVNSGLIAFTGTFASDVEYVGRVWIFIGTSVLIFLVKFIVSLTVPDVDEETEIQLKRNKYFVSKIRDNIPDEVHADFSSISTKNSFTIRIRDDDPL